MVEGSSSGPCMGNSSGDIAEGELTIASGLSYSGSIAADTVERLVVKMMGFCMMVTVMQCLVS